MQLVIAGEFLCEDERSAVETDVYLFHHKSNKTMINSSKSKFKGLEIKNI